MSTDANISAPQRRERRNLRRLVIVGAAITVPTVALAVFGYFLGSPSQEEALNLLDFHPEPGSYTSGWITYDNSSMFSSLGEKQATGYAQTDKNVTIDERIELVSQKVQDNSRYHLDCSHDIPSPYSDGTYKFQSAPDASCALVNPGDKVVGAIYFFANSPSQVTQLAAIR